jgi:ABC-type transport system involved in cytochrome bd biosynthesis fused ATPase/permease subunit
LITLARCLLEKKEIILVDEATANIDSVAEEIVNKVYYKF